MWCRSTGKTTSSCFHAHCSSGRATAVGRPGGASGRFGVVLAVILDADLDAVAALRSAVAVGIAQRVHTAAVFLLIKLFAFADFDHARRTAARSEEHTSELQSLMRNSYAVFCL